MGQLPKFCVQPGPPFNVTGVDYAGPLLIKDGKGRGGKISKCFIGHFICFKCFIGHFICFAIKVVHSELISDLTKEAFIMVYRQFVPRPGFPACVRSDNDTKLIVAYSGLRHLEEFLKQNKQNIRY
ncbi:hypothetical protein QE152_g25200 [Popillia japonica]|uniref:Integrase catalytic domain-containing protein n=1 Tax=Popillia japonica TaxID=7064 RepID=A0AAW1K1E3_POPJA